MSRSSHGISIFALAIDDEDLKNNENYELIFVDRFVSRPVPSIYIRAPPELIF